MEQKDDGVGGEETELAEPIRPKRQIKLRLEDYPLEVLEAVLGILLAQKTSGRGAPT